MTVVYETPYDPETMTPTAPSEVSGFESLDQVVEMMGDDYTARHPKFVTYNGTCYSTIKVM